MHEATQYAGMHDAMCWQLISALEARHACILQTNYQQTKNQHTGALLRHFGCLFTFLVEVNDHLPGFLSAFP